jgi:aspartate aminotransferase-like enzyme
MVQKLEKYGVHITATNREFLNIFKVLNETRAAKGVKYAKAVVINSKVIKDHLDHLETMALPSEEFINLSLEAQKFIQAEDAEGLKKFEEEHAEIIEKRKAQMAEVNAKLDEQATLELKTISETNLPEEISADQLDTLIKIIQ